MLSWVFCLQLLASAGSAHILRRVTPPAENDTSPAPNSPLLYRRDADPADFGWIKRWAAIGDSFTAGIGAGTQLGSIFHGRDDWQCSRYDQAYPMVLNDVFGPAVQKFQYTACSGDRSEGIYKQVTEQLESDMDLVIMTAGGNDLCLAGMIKKCIFLPYDGVDACEEIMAKAVDNVKTILKPNLKQILLALNDKMRKDSIVVYNGYAQFFNTDDEDTCTKNQHWGWARVLPQHIGKDPIPLTVSYRKRYNELVVSINNAIKQVIEDVKANGNVKYKIGFANWDKWAYEGVRGMFCDPKSQGYYPDPDNQPDLQFFKPDTHIYPGRVDLKKREEDVPEPLELSEEVKKVLREDAKEMKRTMYDSVLWSSVDPRAAALHRLDPRAPSPPNCPGDDSFDPTLGIGLPDTFGKNFHPNELGHKTIASFAVERMIRLRAEVLGQGASCKLPPKDEFKCWQKDGSRAYAHPDRMYENYKDFCGRVKQPEHTVGWEFPYTYHEGTPDEHKFTIQLSPNVADFDKTKCEESFYKIINSCDGGDPGNPRDWKFGGIWTRGDYTYRIDVKRSNRPWPPVQTKHGDCDSRYKLVLSSFFLHGAGWATWDYGASLKQAVADCIGSQPSSWKFWYHDGPDEHGFEWTSSFNTPIWVNQRCFNNKKVMHAANGESARGCKGTG